MASYSLSEFLGGGTLKDVSGKLAEEGWDDVPTLKMISAEDMESLGLTNAQRDALDLRIYLHNRSLMKYADRMENSQLGLIVMMNMKPSDIASKFRMRKTHVATFLDTTISCGVQMPPGLVPSTSKRRRRRSSTEAGGENAALLKNELPFALHKSILSDSSSFGSTKQFPRTPPQKSSGKGYDRAAKESYGRPGKGYERSGRDYEMPAILRPVDAAKPKASTGVFSASSASRSASMCGLVKTPVAANVTKVSVLEKISVRPLAPDHRNGVDAVSLKGLRRLQPFKASDLWSSMNTLFFCIRRPGCVMCRAEAHQLFARKPIFDALGIQLVAVLLEDVDEEVWAFWPRYWAGMVVLDERRDFFRALGGGKLMKENLITGFLFNSVARLNFKRALKTGVQYNSKGEGVIKGGLFIVRRGKGGVAYQFAERNFGDWAPLDEVLKVCNIIRDEGES